MERKRFALLALGLLMIFSGLDVVAQGSTTRINRRADRQYDRYAYFKALKFYKKAYDKNPTDAAVILRLADTYRHLDVPEKAVEWYREAMFFPENDSLDNYLHFLRTLMENQRYEEAAQVAETFLQKYPGNPLGENIQESCRTYPLFLKDSSVVRVHNLEANSPESDFGPSIFEGEVIFSSAREKEQLLFGWNGRYFLQLYAGQIGEESFELDELRQFRDQVNTKYHEAIVSFTPDQETMYFTRNNFHRGKRGFDDEGATLLKIFRAQRKGSKWVDVEEIHFNNDMYSVGHPALSADGQTMYFISDMPGGMGGTDVYRTRWNGDDWGSPELLGPEVNTPANEMFPWISPDNILYYSSDGHPGLGGLDLFSAKLVGENFEASRNMGAPFNSSRDDFHLVFSEDRRSGYFSSNRPNGKGSDDIYSFAFRAKTIRGLVVDKASQESIELAAVQMADDDKVRYFNFTDPEGRFAQGMDSVLPLEIIVAKEGYQVERISVEEAFAQGSEDEMKVELVPCGEGPFMEPDTNPALVLSGVIKDDSGKPIKKGKVRIIREIEVTDSKFMAQLEPGDDYIVEIESPELPGAIKRFDIPSNVSDPEIPLEAIFSPDDLPPGRVFFRIYYDFDKSNIRDYDARPELDRVVAFMTKYPGANVELGSHTDSRGTDNYNVGLSQRRAREAYDYIVSKGIKSSRLSKAWYGERVLDQPCPDGVDCSEELHQLNRRTEFKIVSWEGGFRTGPDFQK